MSKLEGIVNKIEFTHGGMGNQFTTINGHKYWTWWDILDKNHPQEGRRVRFQAKYNVIVCHSPLMVGDVASAFERIAESEIT